MQFFCHLNPNVGLLKLIPSMDASLLDYMAEHYDAVIIESFGVGGFPPMTEEITIGPWDAGPAWEKR